MAVPAQQIAVQVAAPQPEEGGPPVRLPQLRQDLKLYPGPRHRDGSPSWRILDPVRNRFFEIGWLEFELLARWSAHETADALIEHLMAETPLHVSDEELADFIQFLIDNQMVVASEKETRDRLRQRWLRSRRPWYERLFHNYLFFRIPLARPDKFLEKTLPLVELFYTRAFAVLVLLVFALDLYLLMREADEVQRSFLYFFNLQGGVYFLLAATFSKIVHELAHAYTAKRYGVRVPAIGVAFLVMWPFLYTDTGETWKLSDRRRQLHIASAGIVSELVLACFATLLWTLTPEGALKQVFFILATTTWIMTLAINASPFMRFDGYFLLSDALDFPNLHERSFACARWWIRRRFFRLEEPLPEPTFSGRQRRALVTFALVTWLYRFSVFIGIALVVYHAFYKPLGVLLFVLEIAWFLVRPVASEAAYIWRRRRNARLAWGPALGVLAALALLVWMVPVAREVTAPAVLHAAREQSVFAPFPTQVQSVHVSVGDPVQEGQVLVRLRSPELELRARNNLVAVMTAKSEYLRGVATTRQQERRQVLLEQYHEALAEQQAVQEEFSRLVVKAAAPGVVRDMRADIVPGRWIAPKDLMLRVVHTRDSTIEAFVSDSQIKSIEIGQPVRFVPAVAGIPTIRGLVKGIDTTGGTRVARPILASPYGGEIPAVVDKKGGVVGHAPLYRVLIEPHGTPPGVRFVTAGTVRIETDLALVAQNFLWRTLSIVVRESGI